MTFRGLFEVIKSNNHQKYTFFFGFKVFWIKIRDQDTIPRDTCEDTFQDSFEMGQAFFSYTYILSYIHTYIHTYSHFLVSAHTDF